MIYCIGHKSPDTDSVASAIAMTRLLNKLGYDAEAAIAGKPNRESLFILNEFALPVPQIITDAKGKRFVVLDHSSYSMAISHMKTAEVLGIVDHHEAGDIAEKKTNRKRIRKVCSCCSLVYELYKEKGIKIDETDAKALLAGILSDTANMKKKVTDTDLQAYQEVCDILKITETDTLYEKMEAALLDYGDMDDYSILMSDYKEYLIEGKRIAMSVVAVKGEKEKYRICDRLYECVRENFDDLKNDMIFIKVENREKGNMVMRAYGQGALEILKNCYGNFDGEKYFVFDKSLSRKNKVIPKIREEMKKRGQIHDIM